MDGDVMSQEASVTPNWFSTDSALIGIKFSNADC